MVTQPLSCPPGWDGDVCGMGMCAILVHPWGKTRSVCTEMLSWVSCESCCASGLREDSLGQFGTVWGSLFFTALVSLHLLPGKSRGWNWAELS